jgi:hypothetical protein
MTPPELNNNIEIGNKLENAERSLIAGLNLDTFEGSSEKDKKEKLKDVLKGTKIKVSDIDAQGKKKEKTLLEIAEDFATYVDK